MKCQSGRETTRAKRLNDRAIEKLRALIQQGSALGNVDNKFRTDEGLNELRGLISGHFYFVTSLTLRTTVKMATTMRPENFSMRK